MKLLIVGEPNEIAGLFQGLMAPGLTVADEVSRPGAFVPPANAPDEPLNDTNAHKDGWHQWTTPSQPGEAN